VKDSKLHRVANLLNTFVIDVGNFITYFSIVNPALNIIKDISNMESY
jgi:hypothetical protein